MIQHQLLISHQEFYITVEQSLRRKDQGGVWTTSLSDPTLGR